MKYYLLLTLCISPSAFAATYLYCPQSSSYIRLGATPDQVEKACGKPTHVNIINSKQAANTSTQLAQENTQWVYNGKPQLGPKGTLNNPAGALTVNFRGKTIDAIEVLNQPVNRTNYCRQNIAVGGDQNDVLNACGKPDYTQNITNANPEKTSQTIIYTYNQAYGQARVLTFENFQLISIQP